MRLYRENRFDRGDSQAHMVFLIWYQNDPNHLSRVLPSLRQSYSQKAHRNFTCKRADRFLAKAGSKKTERSIDADAHKRVVERDDWFRRATIADAAKNSHADRWR